MGRGVGGLGLSVEEAFHETADALGNIRASGTIRVITRWLTIAGRWGVVWGLLGGSGIQVDYESEAGDEERTH